MQTSCSSSFFFVSSNEAKAECYVVMAADSGLKNLQRSDTKCWVQGRQCGSKSNTLCDEEPAYERQNEIRKTRGTKYKVYFNSNRWQKATTFTKGYKVTLYCDSLRATALYAIYINGPSLGCPRGQCEYVHYTLVFDKIELPNRSDTM